MAGNAASSSKSESLGGGIGAGAEGKSKDFGLIAIERGYCTARQIADAREKLAREGKDPSADLPAHLTANGLLSEDQARACERATRGTTVIAGFEILEKIGQGGMGAVFRAKQLSMDRVVALKILPPKLAENPTFKKRFLNEARVSAKLSHLNIINGIDCGEAGGYTFFAMEFVDGKTVKQILKLRGKLPVDEVYDIIRQISDGLVYARRMNLVHRDIKPDNIMLTSSNTAKLCDLGLAKQTENPEDASMTQAGTAVGTPHYISPEQARGEKSVDCRADIYSLGATYYHMLTGRTPFEGTTSVSIMALHISSETKNVCDIDPAIPLPYGQIISKMMAKDAKDRYDTAEALIEDLEAVKNGETPKAASFKGKSSCAMPTGKNTGRARTTGPQPPVSTGKHGAVSTGKNSPVTGKQVPITGKNSTVLGGVRINDPKRKSGVPVVALIGGSVLVACITVFALSGNKNPTAKTEETKKPATKVDPAIPPSPATVVTPREKPDDVLKKTESVTPPPVVPPEPAKVPAPPPVDVARPPEPAPAPVEVKVPVEPPKEAVTVVSTDVPYTKFLRELTARSAKADLQKIHNEIKELAKLPEYEAAKADINAELGDLALAVKFEETMTTNLVASSPEIKLSDEAAKRARVLFREGKVIKYDVARGFSLEMGGAGFSVPAAVLPIDLLLQYATDSAVAAKISYLGARNEFAKASDLVSKLPEQDQPRWKRKLQLLASSDVEIAATAALADLSKVADARNWKAFDPAMQEFDKLHGSTAVAKDNSAKIMAWKAASMAAAAEAAAKISPFKAASTKSLPDGYYELIYDFSTDKQSKDFSISDGELKIQDGKLVAPSGGGDMAFVRFNPTIQELKSLSVQMKTDNPDRMEIMAIGFAPNGGQFNHNEPALLLRKRNDAYWGVMINFGDRKRVDSVQNWSNFVDVALEAIGDNNYKFSVDGKEAPTGNRDEFRNRHLVISQKSLNFSCRRLKIVFKPTDDWLKSAGAVPAAGATEIKEPGGSSGVVSTDSDLSAGILGEYFEYHGNIESMSSFPRDKKPAFSRIDVEIDFTSQDKFRSLSFPIDRMFARWSGVLKVPRDGSYTFFLSSDDGSLLYIDGEKVVNNDGNHVLKTEEHKMDLKAGRHDFRVEYYNAVGAAAINLKWQGEGFEKQNIDRKALFRKKN
jgi:eukaryotic-like serine/threonine-protein kinase